MGIGIGESVKWIDCMNTRMVWMGVFCKGRDTVGIVSNGTERVGKGRGHVGIYMIGKGQEQVDNMHKGQERVGMVGNEWKQFSIMRNECSDVLKVKGTSVMREERVD